MTAAIVAPAALYRAAREHLRGHIEQVGFFLADFDAERNVFVLREWRPMPPEAFEYQGAYHVTLQDEMRPAMHEEHMLGVIIDAGLQDDVKTGHAQHKNRPAATAADAGLSAI